MQNFPQQGIVDESGEGDEFYFEDDVNIYNTPYENSVQEPQEDKMLESVQDNPLLNKKLFENRRRMAWASLFYIFIMVPILIFLVPASKLTLIGTVITWTFTILGGVIAAYMGSSAYAYVASEKFKSGR